MSEIQNADVPVRSITCKRCGGRADYSGEHRLGGAQFTCGTCGVTVTPSDEELVPIAKEATYGTPVMETRPIPLG